MDSNHDKQIQNLQCYRYTTRQEEFCKAQIEKEVLRWETDLFANFLRFESGNSILLGSLQPVSQRGSSRRLKTRPGRIAVRVSRQARHLRGRIPQRGEGPHCPFWGCNRAGHTTRRPFPPSARRGGFLAWPELLGPAWPAAGIDRHLLPWLGEKSPPTRHWLFS